jgi:hypothetical protein
VFFGVVGLTYTVHWSLIKASAALGVYCLRKHWHKLTRSILAKNSLENTVATEAVSSKVLSMP